MGFPLIPIIFKVSHLFRVGFFPTVLLYLSLVFNEGYGAGTGTGVRGAVRVLVRDMAQEQAREQSRKSWSVNSSTRWELPCARARSKRGVSRRSGESTFHCSIQLPSLGNSNNIAVTLTISPDPPNLRNSRTQNWQRRRGLRRRQRRGGS
jgi:hypothetical protein